MTVDIRQEINLINTTFTSDGSTNPTPGFAELYSADYNGETAYFEVVVKNLSTTSSYNVQLSKSNTSTFDTISGAGATISCPANTTTFTRLRSSSFTLDATKPYYALTLSTLIPVGDLIVLSAKIIILQSATGIAATQTQIEVGAYESKLSAAASNTWYPLDEPKYWKYESAKWDPTPIFTFAITYAIENDMVTIDYGIQEDDGAGGWTTTPIATITGLTSETPDYQESSSFTPTNGKIHRLVWRTTNYKYGTDTFNAKIILTQAEYDVDTSATAVTTAISIYGATGTGDKAGQSFTTGGSGFDCPAIGVYMSVGGTPTDNVILELRTTSITGSIIATATRSASGLVDSKINFFYFSSIPTLSASTKYYFTMRRSGSRDVINYCAAMRSLTNTHSGGGYYWSNNDSWSTESLPDMSFQVVESSVTKLQPEYLLINEAQTDTGLQEYLTYFDPDEWDGVSNSYYHEHSADSSSSNTKLQEDPGGTPADITNSSITGDELTRGSSEMTMPTSAEEIDAYIVTA